ncbi:MAG: hypothetical protein FWE95_12255, partial [Planctomycetaceae bacterium]|nr:hypothetical protein [Planctomycetaceae bacterium]
SSILVVGGESIGRCDVGVIGDGAKVRRCSSDERPFSGTTNYEFMLDSTNTYPVEDDGRGILVDFHEDLQKSTLEGVMTVLKFGGKFSKGAYQTSGGLHGVGARTQTCSS